jgi:glycosyltransferase involved in cell wall biosynthesis
LLAPYIYAFSSQAPSRRWLREVCRDFTGTIPPVLQNTKRAWFTDTLEDVNGVSTTIRKMAAEARDAGKELVVVTSRNEITLDGLVVKNFRPIGEFELPEYELQKLSFPPILQMLDYIQRENISEIIISTPGPIGLTALLAGKMLNLEMSGIYHTDFPQYIRILTEDSFLESLAWKYMQWFYGQLDIIFVNSEQYRLSWIERGIDAAKLRILPRGLDTELFTPGRSDANFWKQFGCDGTGVRLLFVGRVSKEKDLDVLVQAFKNLRKEGLPVQLSIVGHGPYSAALAQLLPEACYTGYLSGTDLARAYASADIFVFPSTTDTFGNVILEAQAAGLPVIVSDVGGPRELVTHGVNGLVTRARNVADFTDAIERLVGDESLRKEMGRDARRTVEDRSWPSAFRKFWAMTEIS